MSYKLRTNDPSDAAWCARMVDVDEWGENTSIALLKDGERKAVVVYNCYAYLDICMHVAAVGKHWLNRKFIWAAFAYPFIQLKCTRVTGLIPASNVQSQRFNEHLGFVKEGVKRKAWKGDDLIYYGMLREECRWLNEMRKAG